DHRRNRRRMLPHRRVDRRADAQVVSPARRNPRARPRAHWQLRLREALSMARASTPFSEKPGLPVPLIPPPMGGGPTTPELVPACSAAGALGSFGFAYTQPDEMKRQVALVRSKTHLPFSIDLRVSSPSAPIDPAAQRGALDSVAKYYAELDLPAP